MNYVICSWWLPQFYTPTKRNIQKVVKAVNMGYFLKNLVVEYQIFLKKVKTLGLRKNKVI